MITASDKLRCALREVGYRRHVYKNRVAEGRMSVNQARHEIALMEAIAEDYRVLAAAEELRLELGGEDGGQASLQIEPERR